MNMFCLLEFLSDDYQDNLRCTAQNYSERFENVLDYYGNLFVEHKKLCVKKCSDRQCQYKKICHQYYSIIKPIKNKEILDFFNNIQKCYIYWIDAKPDKALQSLKQLLLDYKILGLCDILDENLLYYKGRETNEELSRYDMYHIPFNKRHLISNQRYSLTGQPIIYLGKSILDIVKELDILDILNLRISYVKFNKPLKLFNGRNNLFENIADDPLKNLLPNTGSTYNQNIFYKNILVWICSFKKRYVHNKNNFCEEYVIPQMLSQILKEENINGVIYTSTKTFSDITISKKIKLKNTNIYDSVYKENIALFTNYSRDSEHDKNLSSNIYISHPIDIMHMQNITIDDITNMELQALSLTKNQDKLKFIEQNIEWFSRVFTDMEINGEDYFESSIGRLHMNILYNALNDILIK